MRSVIHRFVFAILCLVEFNSLNAQQNIILLIADDVSPEYFGCFSTTTDTAITPNIRSLANKGIRFTQMWASPICSPTRAGLLTGRYSFRTGVGAVVTGTTSAQLDTTEMAIAKLLKLYAPVKYTTACIGKWHLHDNTPLKRQYPRRFGYDLYSGNFLGALSNYYQYQRITNGVVDTVYTYATTQTINDALAWLDTLSTNKPFFLWLGFNAPHSPFHLPPANLCDTMGLTGTAADIQANPKKYYKAALQALDTEIGRLLTYLDTHNLRDSTHILFMGDNGSETQTAQIPNPSKAKGTLYDYGVHVPLIISGPAVVGAPRVCEAMVSSVDLFGTIAEMARFSGWKNALPVGKVNDSKSIMPLLNGQLASTRTWLFTEQFGTPNPLMDGKTIRDSVYHLQRFDNGSEALFKLDTDSLEDLNLLANQVSMSSMDWQHYYTLCDTLSALTNTLPCWVLGVPHQAYAVMGIYLNPSNGDCSLLGLKGTWQIRVVDAMGKVCKEQIWHEGQVISMLGLANGVYCIEVQQDHVKKQGKLVWAK